MTEEEIKNCKAVQNKAIKLQSILNELATKGELTIPLSNIPDHKKTIHDATIAIISKLSWVGVINGENWANNGFNVSTNTEPFQVWLYDIQYNGKLLTHDVLEELIKDN